MTLFQFTTGFFGNGLPVLDADSLMLGLVKIMLILAMLLYLAFAVIVIRQVHIMRSTLVTKFSPLVQLASFLHLGLTILVLIIFILIL